MVLFVLLSRPFFVVEIKDDAVKSRKNAPDRRVGIAIFRRKFMIEEVKRWKIKNLHHVALRKS